MTCFPFVIQAAVLWSLRRLGICFSLLSLGFLLVSLPAGADETKPVVPAPIPVILDTDIGDDIDDTWALALLLKSPELDLKLVVGDYGEAQYRAPAARQTAGACRA